MSKDKRGRGIETELAHTARDSAGHSGVVNLPPYRASTILFQTLDDLEIPASQAMDQVRYGRMGTPASHALERALAELEGGTRAVLTSSGLAAITAVFTAFLEAGQHLLIPESIYGPSRRFAEKTLTRLGITVTLYDPLIGAEIGDLLGSETGMVFLESPGSNTFEVQDVPAMTRVCREHRVLTAMDNTWGTPLYCKPLALGVDISIQALTKYVAGHADAMLGACITGDDRLGRRLKESCILRGDGPGSEEIFLATRGLRTLPLRLERHWQSGLAVAEWLSHRAEVVDILHPALPSDPGHELWQRDFTGACGLFGVVLKPANKARQAAFLNNLALFGMGFSWGGFESLILPVDRASNSKRRLAGIDGDVYRLHIGLEDPADLIADLEAGFTRLYG